MKMRSSTLGTVWKSVADICGAYVTHRWMECLDLTLEFMLTSEASGQRRSTMCDIVAAAASQNELTLIHELMRPQGALGGRRVFDVGEYR